MNQNEQDFAPPAFDHNDAADIADSDSTLVLSPDEIIDANAGPAGQGAVPAHLDRVTELRLIPLYSNSDGTVITVIGRLAGISRNVGLLMELI